MWPGFDSQTRLHMQVEFAVGSCHCSEGFSQGSPIFCPPQKINTSKFQFDLETVDEEPLCGNATANANSNYFFLESGCGCSLESSLYTLANVHTLTNNTRIACVL